LATIWEYAVLEVKDGWVTFEGEERRRYWRYVVEYGERGWELTGVASGGDPLTCNLFFKRPKE
jgi:hypothetical protein